MQTITQPVKSDFVHRVVVEVIKLTKESVPKLKKNGEQCFKQGKPMNRLVVHEKVLSSEEHTFLSLYNAQAMVERVNFNAEERKGMLTKARLVPRQETVKEIF